MKFIKLLILFLFVPTCFSQMSYNRCDNALEICPNTVTTVSNIDANKTLCGGCEDDFTFCFTPINTIWLKFTTNDIGGDIQIALSNPIFETQPGQDSRYNSNLIEAIVPCNSTSYSLVGNCISSANNSQTITATALPPNTTYYITLSGEQSGAGITLPAEFNIDVAISGTAIDRPSPFINIGTIPIICSGSLIPIMADRVNCSNPSSFRWFVNGELKAVTPNNVDSIFYTSLLQNGDIVHVESECYSSCPVTISSTLPPISLVDVIADAGQDQTINANDVIQLQGTIGANSTILWTPNYTLSNQHIRFPIANPSITTTYSIFVEDTITGCTATDYVIITVNNGLFFPNTFSPNGDGENDTWEILGIETYPDCLLNIYNRWGQHVFQSTGYNKEKAWNGGSLNEGVYFYEMQLRDPEKQILKGSITLIR
jgi:gliding motility-associated-like protein